ncbi:MAG: ComEC/Rec2 family competence protein [Waterburya sp.]
MTRKDWVILCLAYIVGLLSTNLIADSTSGFALQQLCILIAGLMGLAFISKIVLRQQIKTHIWILAVVVAVMAVLYFQLRIPQPQSNDISYQVTPSASKLITVSGKVVTEPRLNDSQRLKFQLQASEINDQEVVSGKLYATLPLLQGTGIYPGQQLKLRGLLYLPQPASNPGSFDFKQYLARQEIFAGIQGIEAIIDQQTKPIWGWWKLRRRIVRSQLKGLGSPVGQLVSSMVLGRKAVDLPSEVRDRFVEVGLAHVLAASGFHVSLLLGIILKLTEGIAAKPRLVIGIGTLIVYLGLTGIQASVLRACLMGTAVLVALTMETKVKPSGLLLLVATIILLFNPLLISDLGFQLSFLATLGLIVTLPGLQTKLDWLPPTIATLVAVPLAASIWVLPLLCYVFNTIATYSILANILCTPLITVISLGGMISAIAAIIFPALGSAIAWLLLYPAILLIALTKFFTNLPGSAWAIGQISLGVLLTIYGLLILVWLNKWWKKRWWLTLLLTLSLIVIHGSYNSNQFKIAVLAARASQIIVIQDRGQTTLINSGTNNQAKYTVLPFLAQQGINHIDYGFALDDNSNSEAEWEEIYQRAKVKYFASAIDNIPNLTTHRTMTAGINDEIVTKSARLTIDQQLAIINLQIENHTWLIISPESQTNGKPSEQEIKQYIKQHHLELQHPVIVWSGNNLDSAWLELLHPQMAIASTNKINLQTRQQLREKQIKLHNTAQEGMIRWNPQDGFIRRARLLD